MSTMLYNVFLGEIQKISISPKNLKCSKMVHERFRSKKILLVFFVISFVIFNELSQNKVKQFYQFEDSFFNSKFHLPDCPRQKSFTTLTTGQFLQNVSKKFLSYSAIFWNGSRVATKQKKKMSEQLKVWQPTIFSRSRRCRCRQRRRRRRRRRR